MSKSQISSDPVQKYINEHSLRLTNEQTKLIERTFNTPYSGMLGSTDEIQLFQLLLKTINAKRVIEIGTYTGYSSLAMALALPDNGLLITCDINDTHIAKDIWCEAGVDSKIRVEIAPAAKTLQKLLDDGQANTFDFAFIDADKVNYQIYYELCLKLVRPNGIIAVDNVLWSGLVLDPNAVDADTLALKKLNEFIKNDDRVDISMLRVGDGTTLCRKK